MKKKTLEIRHTPVFTKNRDALNSSARFIINQGGTRSSKTYSICQLLLITALTTPNLIISVIRKTGPALVATVYKDFLSVLYDSGLYNTVLHNKSTNSIQFKSGSVVSFFSVDDPQKLRGRKHDIVFLNEANELSLEDFLQINMRTTTAVFIDWNPSDRFSWITDIMKYKDATLIKSSYLDNPFLDQSIINQINALIEVDESYYKIYALGEFPIPREIVFNNWEVGDFPDTNDYVYGMDFGWVDPAAIVKIARIDNTLYVKEELYESYLKPQQLISKMKESISQNHPIFADSARPDLIAEIADAGFDISPANKKIKEGLSKLRTSKIIVTPDSTNTIAELRSYSYKKVKGNIIDEPVDYMNHSIDAMRYGVMSLDNKLPSFMVI